MSDQTPPPAYRANVGAVQPPGWYLDPVGRGFLRWWDGARWGQQTRSLPPRAQEDRSLHPPRPRPQAQPSRQPLSAPDRQYGAPPRQSAYRQQAPYPGTSRGQLYPQATPHQHSPQSPDPNRHRQHPHDQVSQARADPRAWPQPPRRKGPRGLIYAGIAALVVIAGGATAYALAGHGTGSASAAKPLTCEQQYHAWKTGPANAPGKQLSADLSKASSTGSAKDIPALTSALKASGADATTLKQYPMPACADPGGYYEQMLARIKAAADNAGSASRPGGLLLAEAPLHQVPGLEQKLSAELKQVDITSRS